MDDEQHVPPTPSDALSIIDPGPSIRTLLTLQEKHISTYVWNSQTDPTMRDRILNVRHAATHNHLAIPEDIHPWLIEAGFYHVARLRNHEIDHHLISALVERWRPETRTFHMTMGEVTITLEDVHHLLGLPTDGHVVCGHHGRHNFRAIIGDMLGVEPAGSRDLQGGLLNLHFLREQFDVYEVHSGTEIGRRRYTRALILRILGGMLFVDTSSSFVPARYLLYLDDFQRTGTFSWGSAVLAALYRELCKATRASRRELGGCALLVQLWAWTRFPTISPSLPTVEDLHVMQQEIYGHRFNVYHSRQTVYTNIRRYRHHIDVMRRRDIRWRPYEIVDAVHPIDVDMARRWLAVCPLICYEIVVYQQPDRVMRQFGFDQPIPENPINCSELLTITITGKADVDWSRRHVFFIQQWENRDALVLQDVQPMRRDGYLSVNSEYMQWYYSVTRRWMTHKAALKAHVTDRAETVVHMLSPEAHGAFDMTQMYDEAVRMLAACDDIDRIIDPGDAAPPPVRRQTEAPPTVVQRNRRARHEGLPLHHATPSVADTPVVVPPIPPRPPGMYAAPGYPSGLSQQYYWPPQSVPGSQYPPWGAGPSMPHSDVPHASYPMHSTGPSTAGPSSSGPSSSGLHYTPRSVAYEDCYRPAAPTPTSEQDMIFGTPIERSSHMAYSPSFGQYSTDEIIATMDEGHEDNVGDGSYDVRHIIRRNPVREARFRCNLSPFEHNMSRCGGFHEGHQQDD